MNGNKSWGLVFGWYIYSLGKEATVWEGEGCGAECLIWRSIWFSEDNNWASLVLVLLLKIIMVTFDSGTFKKKKKGKEICSLENLVLKCKHRHYESNLGRASFYFERAAIWFLDLSLFSWCLIRIPGQLVSPSTAPQSMWLGLGTPLGESCPGGGAPAEARLIFKAELDSTR